MSEKSPFANQLDNFDENKAAHEAKQERRKAEKDAKEWIKDLTAHREGETEVETYSPEHKQQLEEADAYYEHMKKMADRPNEHYEPWDNSPEAIQWRQSMYERDTENNDRAMNREWDDAIAENKAYDETRQAEVEALGAKFAENAKLRQMDNISKELHTLRESKVDADTIDDVERRIDELDERLQELLLQYSESSDYDPAIADILIDRNDAGAFQKARENALREREIASAQGEVSDALNPEDDSPNPPVDQPPAESSEDEVPSDDSTEAPVPEAKKKRGGKWRKKAGDWFRHQGVKAGPTGKAIARNWRSLGHWMSTGDWTDPKNPTR